MTRRGIKTTDDRGRRVPLFRANRAAFVPTDEARALPPDARSAILASQRVPGVVLALIGWLVGLAVCTGGFGFLTPPPMQALPGALGAAISLAAFILILWFIAWLGGKLNRLLRRRALADAILRAGHCASCGSPMRLVPPMTDGCAACPECGAAWRAERLLPGADPVARIGPELWERD